MFCAAQPRSTPKGVPLLHRPQCPRVSRSASLESGSWFLVGWFSRGGQSALCTLLLCPKDLSVPVSSRPVWWGCFLPSKAIAHFA